MFFPFLKTLSITNIHISVLLKSMSRDQTEKRKRRNSLELSFKDINVFSWNMKHLWRNFKHDTAIYIKRPETE